MAAVEATSVNQNECDDVRIDFVKNGGAMKHSSACGSRQRQIVAHGSRRAKLSFRGGVPPLYDTAHALTARRMAQAPVCTGSTRALSPIEVKLCQVSPNE